jgi:hypothetical protein
MSDQGDAGQWRPAISQSDQHSAHDDTTGPLPVIPEDEAEVSGFPSVSGSSEEISAADDDDAPTGGFPAVAVPDESPAPARRSPFEPVDRSERKREPVPAPSQETDEPGQNGATPRFGTDVPETEPDESSFGSYGNRSFSETSYDRDTFSSETDEPSTGSSTADSFSLPRAEQGVTSEDEAAENDFFAPDDHPPMWDKVVAPAGPPPKPGKPSSGNLRLPDWMREEGGGPTAPSGDSTADEEEGRSRLPLFLGLGVLVVGLIAAAGVYVVKGGGDSQTSNAAAAGRSTNAPSPAPKPTAKESAPQKPLPRFKGVHTKALGRISDARSGLSYARLAKPWALPPKKSPMTELGFSASQFAVTEKAAGQPKHWGRLMSAQLGGAANGTYGGPGTERDAATQVAQMYEERMFGFRHKKRALASQPLNIGGHKGWLVSDYLTYHRPGVQATGDVVTVAVVDTGRKTPGILFMSVPNTSKKLWPDVNYVVRSLRVA